MPSHNRPVLWLTITMLLYSLLGVSSVVLAQQGSIQEAEALDQQVAKLYSEGRYSEAIPLAQKTLAISEKVLGPEHPATATSLNNLAALYHATGAYVKAEPLYQKALAIREKVLGPEHPATAQSLNNLAVFYWANGDLTKVLPFISRAESVKEKQLSSFFLSGSESRKQAYLAQMRGEASAGISLPLIMPDRQARELGFQSVLATKGRVLDAMSDSIDRLRESVKPKDRAIMVSRSAANVSGGSSAVDEGEWYEGAVSLANNRRSMVDPCLPQRSDHTGPN